MNDNQNFSILVVDDTRLNLGLLSNILIKHGYMVRTVASGCLALSSARAEPPDLILLDIVMPKMDGYQVCQKLKADPQTRDIPIIFISALGEVLDKVKAFSLGGVDYVTKPFEAQEVLARVETHLALRRLQKDLQQKNEQLASTLEQLKATQQQLIMQEKMASLGMLTAGIAHETKNPLNFVNGFAALSVELANDLREVIDEEIECVKPNTRAQISEILNDLQRNASHIYEEGQRADHIVSSMLYHSRNSTDQRQKSNINALVAEAVKLAYHSMKSKKIDFTVKVETNFDPTLEPLMVVRQEVSRVCLNLMNNAYDAMYEKKMACKDQHTPRLVVRTKNHPDHIDITIRDNGSGIPAEIRDKVFDPFFTTKPTGEGTGLGLSISYDIIVQRHQGSIKINSEEGQYSEFVICLPK